MSSDLASRLLLIQGALQLLSSMRHVAAQGKIGNCDVIDSCTSTTPCVQNLYTNHTYLLLNAIDSIPPNASLSLFVHPPDVADQFELSSTSGHVIYYSAPYPTTVEVTVSASGPESTEVTNVSSWILFVDDADPFQLLRPWPRPILSVGGLPLLEQDTVALNETYIIDSPSNSGSFFTGVTNFFSNVGLLLINDITFSLRFFGAAPARGDVLVDGYSGIVSIRMTQLGNYSIQLVAQHNGESIDLWMKSFIASPRDVRNSSYGPNGQGCGDHGTPLDTEDFFDRRFTCKCEELYLGSNCQFSNADTCNGNGAVSLDGQHGNQSSCQCFQDFRGPTCAARQTGPLLSDSVIGFLSGGFFVGAILLGIAAHRKRRKLRRARAPHDWGKEKDDHARSMVGEWVQPDELDRKQIVMLSTLGEGEFGFVTKALYRRDSDVDLDVAVKVMKPRSGDSEKLHQDFLQEGSVTAQFKHPNVIQLIGVVTGGLPLLIVLQYCSQGSVKSFLGKLSKKIPKDQGRYEPFRSDVKDVIPMETLLSFCKGIAGGMKYLASKNFIHRDLAARNVLLDAALTPKVSDFGLTRDLKSEEATYYRQLSDDKLPLRWTAIEVLEDYKFSEASDVWAYGVTCIEIYSIGEIPYRGWLNTYVLERVRQNYKLPRPSLCPEDLYQYVILPSFTRDPANRPNFSHIVRFLDSFFGRIQENSSRGATESRAVARGALRNAGITEEICASRTVSEKSAGCPTQQTSSKTGAVDDPAYSPTYSNSSGKSMYEYHSAWYNAGQHSTPSRDAEPTYEIQPTTTTGLDPDLYDATGHARAKAADSECYENDAIAYGAGANGQVAVNKELYTAEKGEHATSPKCETAAAIVAYVDEMYAAQGVTTHASNTHEAKCRLPLACNDIGGLLTDLMQRFDITANVAMDSNGMVVTLTERSAQVDDAALAPTTVNGYVVDSQGGNTSEPVLYVPNVRNRATSPALCNQPLYTTTASSLASGPANPTPPTALDTCIESGPLGRNLDAITAAPIDANDEHACPEGERQRGQDTSESDTDASDDGAGKSFYSPVDAAAARDPIDTDSPTSVPFDVHPAATGDTLHATAPTAPLPTLHPPTACSATKAELAKWRDEPSPPCAASHSDEDTRVQGVREMSQIRGLPASDHSFDQNSQPDPSTRAVLQLAVPGGGKHRVSYV
eukprot:m.1096209 g.1096209  ORF g.1096209 m.1096209 type:complete len:1183 (-) comp24307_c0_seq5:1053-4601(-)